MVWAPAPLASVRSAAVQMTVFDLTCAHTRQANRSAIHSSAVGCRFVTTRIPGVLASVAAPAAAFSASGLRKLQFGQRVRFEVEGSGDVRRVRTLNLVSF